MRNNEINGLLSLPTNQNHSPRLRARGVLAPAASAFFTQTFMVGKVDEESAGLIETAFKCLSAAVDMVQPGAMYRDLGASIGKIARENGERGAGGGRRRQAARCRGSFWYFCLPCLFLLVVETPLRFLRLGGAWLRSTDKHASTCFLAGSDRPLCIAQPISALGGNSEDRQTDRQASSQRQNVAAPNRNPISNLFSFCRLGLFVLLLLLLLPLPLAGCQVVKTYCGHGIGELFHTLPTVPHYPKNKAKGVMKPGHVFTIEPMINLGTWQASWHGGVPCFRGGGKWGTRGPGAVSSALPLLASKT